MMKKNFTNLALALMAWAVTGSAFAQTTTTLYERGVDTDWSDADITAWTGMKGTEQDKIAEWTEAITPTLSDGIYFEAGNEGYYSGTIAINQSANSIVTYDVVWNTGSTLTRYGAYNFMELGDVVLKAYGQDGKATVTIGSGEEQTISTTKTDVRGNSSWTIKVIVNQVGGAVACSVTLPSGEQNVEGISNLTNMDVKVGLYKAGKITANTNQTVTSIKVSEEQQSVVTADYKIKYVCNGTEIKEARTNTGEVDAEATISDADKATFFNSDNTIQYVYASDDSNGKTIAKDGSTVVTIQFTALGKMSYTVKAVDADGNPLKDAEGNEYAAIAEGSEFSETSITVPYHKYILIGTTLYEASRDQSSSGNYYNYVFTKSAEAETIGIKYSVANESVIYFSEAEDIEGMTASSTRIDTRTSNAQGGYIADETATPSVELTTLDKGTYTIHSSTRGGSSGDFSFSYYKGEVAEDNLIVTDAGTYGGNTDASQEFTVDTDGTKIVVAASKSYTSRVLDYVWIEGKSSKTAVEGVVVEDAEDGAVYNLMGQRVAPGSKGILVKKGKKMLVL